MLCHKRLLKLANLSLKLFNNFKFVMSNQKLRQIDLLIILEYFSKLFVNELWLEFFLEVFPKIAYVDV